MGLGGISIWQLLIVLAIVIVLFGTKRLKGMGGDLGGALKSFKSAMNENEAEKSQADEDPLSVKGTQPNNGWSEIAVKDTDKSAG